MTTQTHSDPDLLKFQTAMLRCPDILKDDVEDVQLDLVRVLDRIETLINLLRPGASDDR